MSAPCHRCDGFGGWTEDGGHGSEWSECPDCEGFGEIFDEEDAA